MEIKIGTKQIMNLLNILSWIIFVGLCIETGGIIFNTVYALYKPIVAKHFGMLQTFQPCMPMTKATLLYKLF